MLEYIKKNAQKAYREINSIIESPSFLFSNDSRFIKQEVQNNYCYIHGFNRLIKKNKIEVNHITSVFSYLEAELEKYLLKYYKEKQFVLCINADALVPANTILLKSYYKENELRPSLGLDELVEWYKSNACFDGLKILDSEANNEDEASNELPDSFRSYIRLINT